jgi:hypothetical protein
MPRRLDHVEAAREEAYEHGATFDYEVRSKNIVGFIGLNGKSRKLFMSVTPSDHRVHGKIRKNVRDYIKEMS